MDGKRMGLSLLLLGAAWAWNASAVALPQLPPESIGQDLRLSPQVRVQSLPAATRPALDPRRIEPFRVEPLVVDEEAFRQSPRIVGAPEGRVLITRGDRAYARGPAGSALEKPPGPRIAFRIFRPSRAVHDPVTHALLGYEAHYVGRALLLQAQVPRAGVRADPDDAALPVPALLDIVSAREEIRAGDRLLPEPAREFTAYTPQAPQTVPEGACIAAIYGDGAGLASQNQVVVINKGRNDGLVEGHVLSLVKRGPQVLDRTGPGRPERIQLPDERNGQLMVLRTFDRLSYALILDSGDGVEVGDRVAAPQGGPQDATR